MSDTRVVLKNVRIAFPRLARPEQVNGEGAPAYSAAFILETDTPEFEENEKAVRAALKAAASDKWGAKADAILKTLESQGKVALHDGDTKSDVDGYAGNLFINARAGGSAPPGLYRRDRTAISREENANGVSPAEMEIYGGCYVNVILNIWAQDNKFGKRINASLSGVQFNADGVPFAGTPPAKANDFELLDPLDAPEEFNDLA